MRLKAPGGNPKDGHPSLRHLPKIKGHLIHLWRSLLLGGSVPVIWWLGGTVWDCQANLECAAWSFLCLFRTELLLR